MDAQVRTIVAMTGERLVVLSEADYRALLDAAGSARAATSGSRVARPEAAAAPAASAKGKVAVRCSLEDVLLRG